MSERESDAEQPNARDKPNAQSPQFAPGVGYLIGAAVSLTTAVVLVFAGEVPTGTYAILATLAVAGFNGWLVRSEGSSVKRGQRRYHISREQLRGLLRDAYVAGALRQHSRADAPVYAARAAVPISREGDTERLLPAGLDAESIQAARRISMRLLRDEGS